MEQTGVLKVTGLAEEQVLDSSEQTRRTVFQGEIVLGTLGRGRQCQNSGCVGSGKIQKSSEN